MRGRDMYLGIPVSDKLMMVLWTLANREAYRVLGCRFGLNRGVFSYNKANTYWFILYYLSFRKSALHRHENLLGNLDYC